jgi:Methyltransferase domain
VDNLQFQTTVVDKVEGWLNRVTSLRTMDILRYQEESQIAGSVLEIGVFCGKYFSVLARSAQRTKSRLLGIDTFEWIPESRVQETLAMSSETNRVNVRLLKTFSNEYSPVELLGLLGARPRFVSVDGSHDSNDVYLDLVLSEQIISSKGIIAVDDFLNPIALGVNEAVHKFFAGPRLVLPVAYISNKLFLAHRSVAKKYMSIIEESIIGDKTEPESRHFRESLSKGRHFVEQSLWGNQLLIS